MASLVRVSAFDLPLCEFQSFDMTSRRASSSPIYMTSRRASSGLLPVTSCPASSGPLLLMSSGRSNRLLSSRLLSSTV